MGFGLFMFLGDFLGVAFNGIYFGSQEKLKKPFKRYLMFYNIGYFTNGQTLSDNFLYSRFKSFGKYTYKFWELCIVCENVILNSLIFL